MTRPNRIRNLIIGVMVVCLLAIPVGSVLAQNAPHLNVTLTGQTLTAGFDNNVTVSVLNNYYGTIYDIDVGVSIPTGLTMYGDSHTHFSSMDMGQSVTISFRVYAPTAAIGSTYQGSITVTFKQLGDISYTQEVHAISFSVRGWISLTIYGVQATPAITTPGGNTTISGNLLNSGNLAAFNANVTVDSDTLVPSALSSAFLGEIDPNIPRPFSLIVVFRGSISPGNYTLVVKATAIDQSRPASPYTAQGTARIQIRRAIVQPTGQRANGGIMELLLQLLRYLFDVFFGSTSAFSIGHSLPISTNYMSHWCIQLPIRYSMFS